jgi:hypothetical protein
MSGLIGDRPKRTFAELFRQFRVPLAGAILWTAFKIWEAAPTDSVSSLLATALSQFSAAFFLLSWAWGQYNRVDRQQDTTERLQTIQNSLAESQRVTDRLTEMQGQQQELLTKLASIDPGDPTFRRAFLEASRLTVESSALSAQANTAALTALNATLTPASLGGIYDGGLFVNTPLPLRASTSPPTTTLLSESPKPER